MRHQPLLQSLPVFTCFDCGLRFFVSKLCPNSMGMRLKLPPRSSSYIYGIAGDTYPATLGALDGFHAFYCLMARHAGFVSVFQLV